MNLLYDLPLEIKDQIYGYLKLFDILTLFAIDKKLIEYFEYKKLINLYGDIARIKGKTEKLSQCDIMNVLLGKNEYNFIGYNFEYIGFGGIMYEQPFIPDETSFISHELTIFLNKGIFKKLCEVLNYLMQNKTVEFIDYDKFYYCAWCKKQFSKKKMSMFNHFNGSTHVMGKLEIIKNIRYNCPNLNISNYQDVGLKYLLGIVNF